VKSGWAYCFACLALVCVGCLPPRLAAADAAPPDAAPPDAASLEAAMERTEEARPEGGRISRTIIADENDALWLDGTDERLHYSSTDLTLEVGTDAEIGRTGLRFQISAPPRASITSAKIRLRSETTHTDFASTMTVSIYDSVDVPPFSDLHAHLPEEHDPRHLWGHLVKGFMVCETGEICASPDLAELVQRIVDKPEWTGTGWIGFVLVPGDDFAASSWISFEDSSANTEPPSLEIEYAPPP
jgi:hypothetical protein